MFKENVQNPEIHTDHRAEEKENNTREHLQTLIEIEKSDIRPEEKMLQEGKLLKTLDDRELFNLLFLIREYHQQAENSGNNEDFEKFWSLYNAANFVFGRRDEHVSFEIRDLKELDLAREIEQLSEDIQQKLGKINKVGEEYVFGSSQFWGIEGPPEKIPLSWNNLVFVRKTNNPPTLNASPALLEPQLYVPRSPRLPTLHWTLNSPVASHAYGSWAGSACVIFAPAEKTVAKNGPPLVLNNSNSFWYKTDLVLPEGSVILQEKSQAKEMPIVNDIKIRPDFIEKNKPENLIEEISQRYALIFINFTNLREWLLINRAIIHKMGYTYFANSGWSDSRIDELTRSLRENFGINRFLSVEDERDTELLDSIREGQKIIVKRRKIMERNIFRKI